MIVQLYCAAVEIDDSKGGLVTVVHETHDGMVQVGDVYYSISDAEQLMECIKAAILSIKNRNRTPSKKGPSE